MESASPGIRNAIIPKNCCSEVMFSGIINIFVRTEENYFQHKDSPESIGDVHFVKP